MSNRFEFVKTLATNNWIIKLLAFVAAAITFYGIRMATSQETTIDASLNVEVKEGIAIQEQDTTSVLVTFRGSEDALRAISPGNIRAVVRAKAENIDMPETVLISPRDIKGYSGVRPTVVSPDAVTVSFDSEAVEEIELEAPTIGASSPKIGVAEVVEFEPHVVKVKGSMRKLRAIKSKGIKVRTEPIDVEGRVESFTKMVRVLAPSEGFEITPPKVKVKVDIVTEKITRNLTNVVVHTLVRQGSGANVILEPSEVSLELSGRAEIMEKLIDKHIKVFADCTDVLSGGTNDVPVGVHLPASEGITITVNPPKVRAKEIKGETGG